MMATPLEQIEKDIRDLIKLHKLMVALNTIKGVITSDALATGGKKHPKQGLPGGSGIRKPPKVTHTGSHIEIEEVDEDTIKLYVPILKIDAEKQEVTGVVLQPEVVDAQGDIMSAEVIEEAAGEFLTHFNKGTQLGYMHKDFSKHFELKQSYLAPSNMSIGSKVVKQGAWIMVTKVKDSGVWQKIKDGKINGYSIGGKAKVKQLAA
jgi:hypothetical protein